MAETPPSVYKARSDLALASRYHGAQSTEAAEARQALEAAKIEQRVQALVDDAPPLSDEQVGRIVTALGGARWNA